MIPLSFPRSWSATRRRRGVYELRPVKRHELLDILSLERAATDGDVGGATVEHELGDRVVERRATDELPADRRLRHARSPGKPREDGRRGAGAGCSHDSPLLRREAVPVGRTDDLED